MRSGRTWFQRLQKAWANPRGLAIIILQNAVGRLRGFSYDFNRNGERGLLERLSSLNPRVVFDVGANVGNWSLAAAGMLPNAHLYCFELSPRTCETLRSRLSGSKFTINNCGLGNQSGSVSFKDYGENSTVNTLLTQATYHDERIAPVLSSAMVITGDEYCQQHGIQHIDFLKIDVEGADHLVLEGFDRMLDSRAVRVVQFEYGYTHGDAHFLMRDFYALFERHGYIVGRLEPAGVAFSPWTYEKNDFTSGPNYVAIAGDDAAALQTLSRFG